MIPIIDPVDRTLILKELTADKLLRKTNNGGNEIYVVTARNSPNIMQELGRLRELSFRDAGGGTGAAVDIDAEDTAEEGYQQLFVWDPKAQEMIFWILQETKKKSENRLEVMKRITKQLM